ncbi:hypothetical protein [Fuerstiella marisgermanici]|nr:hypothetical protein [Fuerstiella marisgermanici]
MLSLLFLVLLSGYATDPWHHRLSITRTFHVGVWNTGIDSRLVFFNDADHGPYRGSVVALAG